MNSRIKQIRKYYDMNQTEFGERIGVKQTTIAGYESGARVPLDSVILAICREFNINEAWLKTGEGDMLAQISRSEAIASFAGSLMKEEEESFKRRLFEALAKLDEKDWELLEKIANDALKKD